MKKILPLVFILVALGTLSFAAGSDEGSDAEDQNYGYYWGRGSGPRHFMARPGAEFMFSVPFAAELLSDEPGILVTGVLEDSAATAAGIIRGDIILSVDGVEVNSIAELHDALAQHEAGSVVSLGLLRGGQATTLEATLETRYNMPILGIAGLGQRSAMGGPRGFQLDRRMMNLR